MPSIKVPPHNEEAEQSVLGAILINKDSIGLISEKIEPKDFYSELNAMVFEAMASLYEEGKPIDILTISKRLKKQKEDKVEAS
mgnify:FL=1